MKKPDITTVSGIVGIPVAPPGAGAAIRCLFSTRNGAPGGPTALDFDHRKDDNPVVEASYRAAADWYNVPAASIFVMRQVHGGDVAVLSEPPDASAMRAAVEADAAVTDRAGLVLTVLTADCLPILLADRRSGVIGAVHAGWRSTVAGIAQKAVAAMGAFGSAPGDIFAALGPCIGKCCFEVGPEVVGAVRETFACADDHIEARPGAKAMLDLVGLNRAALERAGVRPERIWSADLCTYCHGDLFYSYRREGEGTGRMLAGIMIEE